MGFNCPFDFLPCSPTCSLGQACMPALTLHLDKLSEINSLLFFLGHFPCNSEVKGPAQEYAQGLGWKGEIKISPHIRKPLVWFNYSMIPYLFHHIASNLGHSGLTSD